MSCFMFRYGVWLVLRTMPNAGGAWNLRLPRSPQTSQPPLSHANVIPISYCTVHYSTIPLTQRHHHHLTSRPVTLVVRIPFVACTLTWWIVIFGGENDLRQRSRLRSQNQCNSAILHIHERFIEQATLMIITHTYEDHDLTPSASDDSKHAR